jgi:hypothetical protein
MGLLTDFAAGRDTGEGLALLERCSGYVPWPTREWFSYTTSAELRSNDRAKRARRAAGTAGRPHTRSSAAVSMLAIFGGK